MKKVVVTGASGFLGHHVLAPLQRRGFAVHALYKGTAPGDRATDVHWHQCDLFDDHAVRVMFESIRPTGLLHLAWETKPGAYWAASSNLDWVAATLRMLQHFRRVGGARLVIAGSSAEYQWGGDQLLDEIQTPLLPASLYGHCKNALREIVQAWAPAVQISWAWGRIFNIFGSGENSARLIPKIVRTLEAGEQLPFDSGACRRDFLHVADAADAFADLFASSVTGAVNVASGEATPVKSVVSTIAHCLDRTDQVQFDTLPAVPEEHAQIVAAVRRLREEVCWRPAASLEVRLRETCAAWRKAHPITRAGHAS